MLWTRSQKVQPQRLCTCDHSRRRKQKLWSTRSASQECWSDADRWAIGDGTANSKYCAILSPPLFNSTDINMRIGIFMAASDESRALWTLPSAMAS